MNEVKEENIREEIKKCDLITDFDTRLACKSKLLHEITQFQDIVNLDIMSDFRRTDPNCSRDPRWTPVHLVDNANAVILGISQYKFDPKTFWHEGSYVYEKYINLCTRLRYDLPTPSGSRPNMNEELSSDEKAICRDFLRKISETKQVYIVEHDVPISISRSLYDMLDSRRRLVATQKGVPEIQYEWEDLFFEFLGRETEDADKWERKWKDLK